MFKLVQGIRNFQRHVFPAQRHWFERLAAKVQTPQALLITCSDSRINPNLLTQTEPGDLFLLRNAGNIVPAYGAANGGEGATIEYAVSVLGIRNLIVCGHSNCGAMDALLHNQGLQHLPAVAAWFAHAESTRRILCDSYSHLTPDQRRRVAIEQNVLVQLDHLRTHPCVASGLARGEVNLYGWVYVLETGEVLAFDPEQGRFAPIREPLPRPMPVTARLTPGVNGRVEARVSE
jgi:carbonic anhydrase